MPRAFFAAVHRGMFFSGALQSVLVMLLWAADLGARRAGLWSAPPWPLPGPWLHGLFTMYGIFPFFIFGFVLTAGPRWQGYAETPPRVYLPLFWLLSGGWLLAWVGLAFPVLLAPGLVVACGGWAVATRHVWTIAATPNSDRRHILAVAAAITLGGVGLALFAAYVATGDAGLARAAIAVGVWGYLLPVFVVVLHRMLPFFSSSVIPGFSGARPFWALWTILVCSIAHGALGFAGLDRWMWLVDQPAALAALHLTWLWRWRESFAATILAVLHVGFAWCGIAFALSAVNSLMLFSGGSGLGLAPLHAMTLGFFASTLIGMASRVTLGHSGRHIEGDATLWGAFWTLQAATVLRIAGEFVFLPGVLDLSFLAVLLWLGAFGTWTVKYAPNTWRPRADGQPG